MANPVLVLMNRAAGRGRSAGKYALVRAEAEAAGAKVEEPDSPEDLEHRAREAALSGCPRVIAAGGDGTVHRVLNGIVGTGAALGIIPCGSGNDLASNLRIPGELGAAARLAFSAPARAVDLCRLEPAGRYFACIASFGLDSRANRIANLHRGPFRGTGLYVYSLLRALLEFEACEVTVSHGEGQYRGRILLLVAANAPSYGGGMRIAPMAETDDGRMDLVMVGAMPRWKLLWCFPEVFNGRHISRKEVTCLRATRARIEADRPLEIFADGEYAGTTPAEVELLPGALRVIAPGKD